MKIKKSHSTKKVIILSALLFLIIGVVGLIAYYSLTPTESPSNAGTTTDQNDTTPTEGRSVNPTIPDAKEETVTSPDQPSSDPVPEPTPSTESDGKSTVGMEITAANQNDSTVTIRTLIEAITSLGTCKLIIKAVDSGKTYQASAGVQALPSSSTCKGFSVPVSELGTGQWNIAVTYESNDLKGSSSRVINTQ